LLKIHQLKEYRVGKACNEENIEMVIDFKSEIAINDDLESFLKNIDCSDMQFKLLNFWSRHPRAKLSLYTMTQAMSTTKVNLRDEIEALVDKGMLSTERNENGLSTYSFSQPKAQRFMDDLSKLDWAEAIRLGNQLKK
jgi:hypothetical protein